jgi:c-di-AMP phosphodiesterase-like protein
MLKRDIEKYKNDIEIVSEKKMDLGSIVIFHCENEKVLDEIFSEE